MSSGLWMVQEVVQRGYNEAKCNDFYRGYVHYVVCRPMSVCLSITLMILGHIGLLKDPKHPLHYLLPLLKCPIVKWFCGLHTSVRAIVSGVFKISERGRNPLPLLLPSPSFPSPLLPSPPLSSLSLPSFLIPFLPSPLEVGPLKSS